MPGPGSLPNLCNELVVIRKRRNGAKIFVDSAKIAIGLQTEQRPRHHLEDVAIFVVATGPQNGNELGKCQTGWQTVGVRCQILGNDSRWGE